MSKAMEIAKEMREKEKKKIDQAYSRIPEDYHEFIILLEQSQLVSKWAEESKEAKEMGLYTMSRRDGKWTYINIQVPYMSVNGRVAQMVDMNTENEDGFTLDVHPESIGNQMVMVARYTGLSSKGKKCTTVGRAKVGFGGTGADMTNPIENAETSAIGRALGLAGYGLLGTGIASADEVEQAIKEQRQMRDGKRDAKFLRASIHVKLTENKDIIDTDRFIEYVEDQYGKELNEMDATQLEEAEQILSRQIERKRGIADTEDSKSH